MHLTVLVKNERAIKLYDKCGFRIEGTLRENFKIWVFWKNKHDNFFAYINQDK